MNNKTTMKEMPADERPYEKLMAFGAENLTDKALLAIMLRSGTPSHNVMEVAGQLLNMNPDKTGLENLICSTYDDFIHVKGIGKVKAIQLSALCEISRRFSKLTLTRGAVFDQPDKVAAYYMADMRGLTQEELHIMLLDTKSRMISERLITKGTINASLVSPRDILVYALRANAVSFIMIHNHPSGDPTPSSEDFAATSAVLKAAQSSGLTCADHIIIGDGRYVSFKKDSLLPEM